VSSLAVAVTTVLVAGCVATATPRLTASPSPSPSAAIETSTPAASIRPTPTRRPTVAPLSWGQILGEVLAIDSFVVFRDPAYDNTVLVVQEQGQRVGFVNLWTLSSDGLTVDVSTPGGLARVAADFVETVRVDRAAMDPAGTFTPMDPTEVAVGASRGFRSGFAFEDHLGNVERVVEYVVSVPGGIAIVMAHFPQGEVGLLGFDDDATLVRFLPVLDEVVAGLSWPYP
jgi:hypothetical protein